MARQTFKSKLYFFPLSYIRARELNTTDHMGGCVSVVEDATGRTLVRPMKKKKGPRLQPEKMRKLQRVGRCARPMQSQQERRLFIFPNAGATVRFPPLDAPELPPPGRQRDRGASLRSSLALYFSPKEDEGTDTAPPCRHPPSSPRRPPRNQPTTTKKNNDNDSAKKLLNAGCDEAGRCKLHPGLKARGFKI